MKGRLFLRDDKWYVEYQIINSVRSLPLHKDSVRQLSLRSDKQPEHMHMEEIEFEIVKEYTDSNTNQVQQYTILTKCNGLDLKQLEAKLDIALANETKESLSTWFSNKRNHPDALYTREDMVDFANWISRDWMSIWVKDKWMWEYQKEVGPYHPYFGYLMSEQLFKMYLVDKHG
jgi:hypothetical protein